MSPGTARLPGNVEEIKHERPTNLLLLRLLLLLLLLLLSQLPLPLRPLLLPPPLPLLPVFNKKSPDY